MYGSDMDIRRKFLPCSSHDIAKLEAWLEDMAAQGLRLQKIQNDIATFETRNPAEIRYRLFVQPKDHWFVDGQPAATPQLINKMQAQGWQYVTKFNRILYFATENTDALEPERDAMDMIRLLTKKKRKSVMISMLLIMFITIFFAQFSLYSFVLIGTGLLSVVYAVLLGTLVNEIRNLMRMRHWRRLVETDQVSNIEVDWKQGSGRYRVLLAITLMISMVFLVGIFVNGFVDLDKLNRVHLSDVQDDMMIYALEDLYPQYHIDNTEYCFVERDFDLLSPIVLKTELFGDIYDDAQYLGIVEMDTMYFLTWHEAIAHRLAGDYTERVNEYQSIVLPAYNVDYAAAYQSTHQLHVILQNENRLICVEYELRSAGFPQTAEQIAELYLPVVQ